MRPTEPIRDGLTIVSTYAKLGNSWCIPIRKHEMEALGGVIGDVLEVTIKVKKRSKDERKRE